jgi:hypothetical protein
MDYTQRYPVMDSDDAPTMEKRMWPRHEFHSDCIPASEWQHLSFPTCSTLHGTSLRDLIVNNRLRLLSDKGFWRLVWELRESPGGSADSPEAVVLKTFK